MPTSKSLDFSPFVLGATGEQIRDLYERLDALGLTSSGVRKDTFTESTVTLVEAFQRTRGLPITGIVDDVTWSRLEEARWKLGQRLLYLTEPYLRGDDVADLQVRLSRLGFDPGRIDGLFGPLLDHALREFQSNCGLEISGVLSHSTWMQLLRITPSMGDQTLVTDVRDVHRVTTRRGPSILWGSGKLHSGIRESFLGELECPSPTWSVEEMTAYANHRDAPCVIVIDERPELSSVHLNYWAGYRTHSRLGEQLSSSIMVALTTSSVDLRVEVRGMALPVLRETRMTTLLIEYGSLDSATCEVAAQVIARSLDDFIHNRVPS